LGYDVKWVMNVTDVGHLVADSDSGEDKMEVGSKREGLSAWEIAKKYENEFFDNFKNLNILRPDIVCRATEHIKEQIELLKKMEVNGFIYRISDGIYFDTSKFFGYGDFANLDMEKIREGARVGVNSEKKNPSDFALWKFSPTDGTKRQMEWDSPWGRGFPGWHLECTAMSTKYLGETFDIHTGGIDHISIHHTNEIAQGFGAFGHQTANYWMHNAFITFGGTKISKSSGGLTLNDLIKKGFDPIAYRYMVLTSHYRKALEFSEKNLENVATAYLKLKEVVMGDVGEVNQEYRQKFIDFLVDDLAMPEVLALIWKLVKDSKIKDEDKRATILDFDLVLGLKLEEFKEEAIPDEVRNLAKDREKARRAKNWDEADRLRQEIKKWGFAVEDREKGGKIKRR
jgi:cysteinyl-tRNA synthetase